MPGKVRKYALRHGFRSHSRAFLDGDGLGLELRRYDRVATSHKKRRKRVHRASASYNWKRHGRECNEGGG